MNSLRTKILGIIVTSLIIALSIYSTLLYINLKRIIVVNQEEHLSALAVAVSRDMAQWLDGKKREMSAVADSISLARDNKSSISTRLKLHAKNNPKYEMVFFADTEGNAVTSSDFQANIADRTYFQEILSTGKEVVSDPVMSRQSKRPIVVIAAPVKKGSLIAGVVGCTLSLDYLSELTSHIKPASTGYAFVVQGDGTTIIHPDRRLVLKHNILKDPQIDPSLKNAVSKMISQQAGLTSYVYDNVGKYLAFAPIPGTNWATAINAPMAEVLSQLSPINKLIILTPLFVVILASALLSTLLIIFIVRPITALRNSMARVEGGDLNVQVDYGYRDEIGQLTDSFNSMVQTIKHGKESIQNSEEQYRALFENAVEGFFQTTPDGRILSANPSLALILGFDSTNELIAKSTDISGQHYENPEDRETFKNIVEKEGLIKNFETRLLRKDGGAIWVSLSARAVRDENGTVLYYEGNLEDVSKRKLAETALKASERRLANIIDFLPDATFGIDLDSRIIVWNKAIEEMTGYTAETMMGKGNHEYAIPFYGERRPILVDFISSWDSGIEKKYSFIRKDGDTLYTETEVPCVRGKKRVLWAKASPLRDEQGNSSGAIETIRDITDLKNAEANLRESGRRIRELFDGSRDGFVVINNLGGFIEANPAYCDMLGYTLEELRSIDNFYQITPVKWRQWEEDEIWNGRLTKDGYSGIYEKEYIRKDGKVFPVEIQGNAIFAEDGTIRYIWGVARDITERKRAEEEREKLQSQLNQAQKMESVGRLAGGVAHDFNNMLGVIIGHAELAMNTVNQNQTIYDRLREIHKAAERSADLTRQLLAFARKQTVAPKVLDLNETVEGMLKMIRRLIGENIDLAWLPGKNLVSVKVDPSQIDQILANLCVNARDAIGDMGRVTIETNNIVLDEAFCAGHAGSMPGEYVMMAVSDDGCGMDSETLDKLFEPFFTTKEAGKGTGLGLSTVYGIVQQNEGYINVSSKPGQGTTFRIYLPRHNGKVEQHWEKGSTENSMAGHETILLVEDEPAILEMCRMVLENLGYRVLVSSLPGKAIRLAETYKEEIHLLMTDVVMPEMNGRDLAKNLLSLYPHIKRLFMSGYTADVIAHHGVLNEGVYFIQKPFSIKELASKVREALDQ